MELINQFNAIAKNAVSSKNDRPVVMLFGKARDLGIFGRIVKYLSQIGRQSKLRHDRNEKVATQFKAAISEHYGPNSRISSKFENKLGRLINDLQKNQKSLSARDIETLVTKTKKWEMKENQDAADKRSEEKINQLLTHKYYQSRCLEDPDIASLDSIENILENDQQTEEAKQSEEIEKTNVIMEKSEAQNLFQETNIQSLNVQKTEQDLIDQQPNDKQKIDQQSEKDKARIKKFSTPAFLLNNRTSISELQQALEPKVKDQQAEESKVKDQQAEESKVKDQQAEEAKVKDQQAEEAKEKD